MKLPSARNLTRLAVLVLMVAGKLVLAASDDTSRLVLEVLREDDKKPVASAHVVVRFADGHKFFFKKKHTSWEAKTDLRGELILDDIPSGPVKIQVIAKGFRTFGGKFDLTKPVEEVTIKLKPPAPQVSAY